MGSAAARVSLGNGVGGGRSLTWAWAWRLHEGRLGMASAFAGLTPGWRPKGGCWGTRLEWARCPQSERGRQIGGGLAGSRPLRWVSSLRDWGFGASLPRTYVRGYRLPPLRGSGLGMGSAAARGAFGMGSAAARGAFGNGVGGGTSLTWAWARRLHESHLGIGSRLHDLTWEWRRRVAHSRPGFGLRGNVHASQNGSA